MFEVGQRVRIVNHPDPDIVENQWVGTVMSDPPTRRLMLEPYGEIQGHEYTIETKYLELIPPTDSELRQKLLDAGFEANPSGYISSQIPDVDAIFVETIGKTKAVFVGSKYIPCNSLASAVTLAICIKKVTEPTGVDGA